MHVSSGICLQKTLGAKFVGKKVYIEENCHLSVLDQAFHAQNLPSEVIFGALFSPSPFMHTL